MNSAKAGWCKKVSEIIVTAKDPLVTYMPIGLTLKKYSGVC